MDMKITMACRVPFHDSMPSFMNLRRVLDLLEIKNKVSQGFAGNQWCLVFEIHSISCMGPKRTRKDKDLIFQSIYMHWSLCM